MSEYAEDFEDDLEGLFEDEEDDQRVAAINATISGLEASYGVELDDDQAQLLGTLIDQYDHDPIEAWESLELGPDDLEAEFENLAERVEEDQARKLTESELQRLWQAQQYAVREDHDEVDVSGVVLDLDDSDQRAAYIGEVLRVEPEEAEPSTPAINQDGEEVVAFDLSSSDDRAAVIDRMMAGENAAIVDNEEGD